MYAEMVLYRILRGERLVPGEREGVKEWMGWMGWRGGRGFLESGRYLGYGVGGGYG